MLALSQDGNGVQSTTVSTTTPAEPQQQQENTNSIPTASSGTVATDEDTDHAFSASEFNYSDSDSDTLASVKITELPAADRGRLTLDGTAINSADLPKTITKAELDDGKLKYSPPADANGTGYASFRFKVNNGTQDSASQYTMTISVTAVNDPATGAPAISGAAEVGEILTAATGSISDSDGLPGSFTHQWKRFAADGTTFEQNIGTDSDTYTLTASELGKKVRVEISFTDNEGSSEGPLASSAYPSDATVEASSPGISIIMEAPPRTTVGSAGTVSADIVGFDVFPDPEGHEYTYRIDVLDSDRNDADVCEGNGMGEALRIFESKTAWIFVRRGATELREAQISDECEIGSYTARASVSDSDSALLVSAEAEFEITPQPPAAPTGLTTQGVTHNSITLSWTDPEDTSITGYRVLRGNEAGKLTAIADDTGSDSVEYTDSTVAAEIAYFYAVLALSQNADGAQSAEVGVTTRAAPEPKKEEDKPPNNRVTKAAPGVPLNLAVVSGDTQLTYTWDPPASDGGSAIIRYNYEFGPTGGTLVDENHGTDPTGSQTFRKTGLINGTGYTLKLRAVNRSGGNVTTGAYVTVTGTPQANVPAVGTLHIFGPIRVHGTVFAFFHFQSDSDGITQPAIEYQWFRVDGITDTAITGATSKRYTLTAADVGKKLKVQLSFEDNRGNTESFTSAAHPASGTIQTTAACAAPTYTGGATQLWTSKMTLGVDGTGVDHGFNGSTTHGYGTLVDRTFDVDTTEYTINRFRQQKVATTNEIQLSLDSRIATAEEGRLALYVCDTQFRFADATYSSTYDVASGHFYTWDNTSGSFDMFENGTRKLYISRDTTAPEFKSAVASGTSLVITFDEDLAAADSLANSAFTVKKTSSGTEAPTTLSTTTAPVISGKTVTLTLATALVSTDTGVKVGYTKPTTGTANKLVDASGNATGTFTDQDVTSNAVPLAPARPIVAPVPRTTDSLTVNWTAPTNTGRPAITSYDVRYRPFEGTWINGPQDVSGGPVTLEALPLGPNFGLYQVQVRATNTAGDGPWSESAKETLFPPEEEVTADLGLVPAGLRNGDRFRLLFIGDNTNAESDQGSWFDDLVQSTVFDSQGRWPFFRQSDGAVSSQRALLSAPGVDARVRTDTTFTAGDKGVPIYWLRGSKVADDYEDFYDGNWDDEASPTDSTGTVITVTTQPWTGSTNDGTELFAGTVSQAMGRTQVGIAGLSLTTAGHGPLSGGTAAAAGMRPLFGLTQVYVVSDDRFLASNMAQTSPSGDKRSARRSQRFTTGSNPGGYALDSVTLSANSVGSSTQAPYTGWSVSVYTVDESGHPAAEHTTLAAPQAYIAGRNAFTTPAGTTLSADTTYAVVVTAGTTTFLDGTTTTDLDLDVTTSNSENERSASDWNIFDAFDIESGSSWSADTGSKALYIAVRGAPVPDKPTGLSAIPSGGNQIDLSWTTPADNGGSAVTGYKIEVSSDGGTNWTDLVADTGSTTTTYSQTGLSAGDTRHYRVSAISINGTGPASDTTMATIAMATIASAATGVPAITAANAFRVPGVLTANKGSIADANGLPLESTFTWQWVQVDGMTETDILSATSQTYTLTATDVGKKIKVKASFTDTGTPPNAEGPLTSAAYPSSGSILPVATDCLPPTSYPGGAAQIWTGRVTIGQVKVGNDPLSIRGYLSQSTNLGIVIIPATDAAGTLSNTAFAAGSQYTIKLAGTQIVNNTLLFATTPAMTAADRKQLTLYVCDEAFLFSEVRSSNEVWFWSNTGLDWRDKVDRNLYISRDQTAPTVSSFDVTGTTLTLTFTEDLGAAASLANSAFEVKKTSSGTETTVTLTGTPAISGRTVTLTLAATVPTNNRITVNYTKPTSGTANRLVDRFGNEVEDFNQVVAEVPGAPTGLSAAPNGTTGIDLSWTAPADDGGRVISGYKIEISTDGGTSWTVLVANTGSTDTTYAHSGLTAGSARHYRVSAINTIGASAASNTANANTPNTADHRPTSSTSRVTATEDTAFTFSGSDFAFFDNDAGATLVNVKITALLEEGRGTLAFDGTAITSSVLPRTVTKAELDAGKLIYTPPNNWNGHATFRFKVNDGSVDSASAYTMLVSVTPVNDLPTSAGKTVTIIKGDAHTFEVSDFAFTDVDDRDTLASVKITTVPIAGTLTLRGVAITVADLPKTVTQNDLDRNRLRFVPADNARGANYASFKFKVNDGTDDSASEYTLRMSINRPATGLPTITGMAHVGATLTADTSGIKDEDGLGRFTYQWISNNGRTDTDITDATGSTYELVETDERKRIKVKVSFTDRIGNKENLTSAATGRVAARPNRLPTGKPAITGTPRVGETLTASTSDIADADGLPNTFRYRWKRFTLPGVFNANTGSNSNTYVLTSSDIAMQMKLEVSYTDGRGAYETLISDAYPRRNGVEPAPTFSDDCIASDPCLELIRPVAKIPLNYDGDLTLGVEKTYTHGVTYIPAVRETDRSNVTGDKAIYRIRLEPGQKYRFTVRRDTIGGDSFGRYGFGIGHLQTTCVDIFGCDHLGGVEPIHLDKRTTNAPLVHPGALTSLTEKDMNYSQFFQEFQTPCLPGSPDACGPALLNNYDYPHYYYAVVDPASGAAAGERVHLKVERLPSTHVLADSPLDDQYAWQLMADKDGKSGYVLNFIGASMGMWNGSTVSGYLDDSNDVDMHRTFRTANQLDCKITPAGHASGTPAKAATNLKIKTEDGLPRDSIDSVTLDPFSYVEVYSTTGDTGGYQITASECARNTTYYAERGVVKRNQPTELVVGRWLTAELEEPSSEAVTVTAEDDFDLIKFGRAPGPSNWTLKPGEKGLVEYNTNLHKITLNAGTSYNMKRRGDLRNDLAIFIVNANDSCDDQKFISGSSDFIQYDAEDENDGSEFTPILHYSALNTRSDTDTDTGTSECYIIAVEYLHGHNQKFGPYSILVTEN